MSPDGAGPGVNAGETVVRGWTAASVLLRALAVQGSWNYETLTGTGFAFVLLPALRQIHSGDPAALDKAIRRHEGPFNSHPYLAPLALGAVIRMEEEGEDPVVIDRFKAALRGSLGTLGDQLIWTGWRPVCLLGALTLLALGVPWWAAVVAFLCAYNLGHLGLMYWGFSVGLNEGRAVAGRLRGTVRSTQPRLMTAGAFLVGVVVVLVAVGGIPLTGQKPPVAWVIPAAVGVAAAIRWGVRVRRVVVGGVLALAIMGVLAGVLT
jgi:PTS system mannose-specific IID component